MHFEILVEDRSGKKALDILVPKIIGGSHTFRVLSYKGIGHIPKNLCVWDDVKKRMLLAQLPRLLRAYGKTFNHWSTYAEPNLAAVIVVCDLDDKCLKAFRQELFSILNACNPQPKTRFCIAIEEGEAWLLGDSAAIKSAYPNAKDAVLKTYQNDSICATWEKLADAVCPGAADKLLKAGRPAVGLQKSDWANTIAPYMDVDNNVSQSFGYFREKLLELAEGRG